MVLGGGAVSYERGSPVQVRPLTGPPREMTFGVNAFGLFPAWYLACNTSRENKDPAPAIQGYLAHKKLSPPEDHRSALGMVLL